MKKYLVAFLFLFLVAPSISYASSVSLDYPNLTFNFDEGLETDYAYCLWITSNPSNSGCSSVDDFTFSSGTSTVDWSSFWGSPDGEQFYFYVIPWSLAGTMDTETQDDYIAYNVYASSLFTYSGVTPPDFMENIGLFLSSFSPFLLLIFSIFVILLGFSYVFRLVKKSVSAGSNGGVREWSMSSGVPASRWERETRK